MTTNNQKAFTRANYEALNKITHELNLDEIHPDESTRIAQECYEKGYFWPRNGLEPKETFLLKEIMTTVTPENFPPLLIVYLNDRLDTQLPESDFSTLLERRVWKSRKDVIECVTKINKELKANNNVERA